VRLCKVREMKFASLGHLDYEERIKQFPKEWIGKKYILSPEINLGKTSGYFIGLKYTARQIMSLPVEKIRREILQALIFAQNELDVELVQLGALTTSVTQGGKWVLEQKEFNGFVNHGDSYTAATTCQAVFKILDRLEMESSELTLAIVGAYGIIGEALSKLLTPKFSYSILIGRRREKLEELKKKIEGNFEITTELKTQIADVVITATNHPSALLSSSHLKKNAIVIDVAQPPNVSASLCKQRPDIIRIDGGIVTFPSKICIPSMPKGKIFACIAEVIMQAMENNRANYVGSISLEHLKKTKNWAKKYGYTLDELTNFGKAI